MSYMENTQARRFAITLVMLFVVLPAVAIALNEYAAAVISAFAGFGLLILYSHTST